MSEVYSALRDAATNPPTGMSPTHSKRIPERRIKILKIPLKPSELETLRFIADGRPLAKLARACLLDIDVKNVRRGRARAKSMTAYEAARVRLKACAANNLRHLVGLADSGKSNGTALIVAAIRLERTIRGANDC